LAGEYLTCPMLKMDFSLIGNCIRLCRSWSCPLASSAFSGNSLVIKPYLKSSRAVLKIICRASHASSRAIFVIIIRVRAVFCSVHFRYPGWEQMCGRQPRGHRRSQQRCRGDRGRGIQREARDAPQSLAGAVPAGV